MKYLIGMTIKFIQDVRILPITNIIELIGFVFLLATGQLLFKKAALTSAALNTIPGFFSLMGT